MSLRTPSFGAKLLEIISGAINVFEYQSSFYDCP